MWFDSWSDVLRVLLVGSASYVTLVLVLRASEANGTMSVIPTSKCGSGSALEGVLNWPDGSER